MPINIYKTEKPKDRGCVMTSGDLHLRLRRSQRGWLRPFILLFPASTSQMLVSLFAETRAAADQH